VRLPGREIHVPVQIRHEARSNGWHRFYLDGYIAAVKNYYESGESLRNAERLPQGLKRVLGHLLDLAKQGRIDIVAFNASQLGGIYVAIKAPEMTYDDVLYNDIVIYINAWL